MIHWEIDHKTISRLYVGNENIIYPWGYEFSDSSSFFSLEDTAGWRYKILQEEYRGDNNSFKALLIIRMREGLVRLTIDEVITGTDIIRRASCEMLEDTYLVDFVMRFRFKKEYVKNVEIAGRKLFHMNSQIYYQYPVNRVHVHLNDYDIDIKVLDSKVPSNMHSFAYARDAFGEWVIHFRMLPRVWDKEVIKLCSHWFRTKHLPNTLTRLVLKSRKIKESLWYRSELRPYRLKIFKLFSPNAYPLAKYRKGECLEWIVQMKIQQVEH